MRTLHALLTLCFLFASATAVLAQALPQEEESQATPLRRDESRRGIPGHYTLGFYADREGTSTELQLEKGSDEFEVWIGVTGDSTRIFSGLAMRLELPPGVDLDGPIRWIPRDRLSVEGTLMGEGIAAGFPHECAEYVGPRPVMLGRLPLRLQPGVTEATVAPSAHHIYGLSVELCSDARAWPKPFADPVATTVRRHRNLWDRLTGWFR